MKCGVLITMKKSRHDYYLCYSEGNKLYDGNKYDGYYYSHTKDHIVKFDSFTKAILFMLGFYSDPNIPKQHYAIISLKEP